MCCRSHQPSDQAHRFYLKLFKGKTLASCLPAPPQRLRVRSSIAPSLDDLSRVRRSSYHRAARAPALQVWHNDTRSSSYSSEFCRMEAQRRLSIRRRGPPGSLKVATTEVAVIEAPLEAPPSSPSLALRWTSPDRDPLFQSRSPDGAIVLRDIGSRLGVLWCMPAIQKAFELPSLVVGASTRRADL
jgi:hypothetical protein